MSENEGHAAEGKQSSYVIEHGGDVELKNRDRTHMYDRIIFTESGVVVCINKKQYSKDCYPREAIEGIHTHTSDEEESAEWW